jgi:hypothetical protein
MNLSNELSRRGMLMKVGILFNGAVGMILAVPIIRYILSPVIRERKPGYESWLSLGSLDQFPEAKRAWRPIETRSRIHRMGRPKIFPAGCVTLTMRSSRFLRSIAHISDVRSVGSRSPAYSCVRATVVFTIRTVLAPPDPLSVACLNIVTNWSRAIC